MKSADKAQQNVIDYLFYLNHDIRGPMSNMVSISELLVSKNSSKMTKQNY